MFSFFSGIMFRSDCWAINEVNVQSVIVASLPPPPYTHDIEKVTFQLISFSPHLNSTTQDLGAGPHIYNPELRKRAGGFQVCSQLRPHEFRASLSCLVRIISERSKKWGEVGVEKRRWREERRWGGESER